MHLNLDADSNGCGYQQLGFVTTQCVIAALFFIYLPQKTEWRKKQGRIPKMTSTVTPKIYRKKIYKINKYKKILSKKYDYIIPSGRT